MPTYDYQCATCGKRFEHFQSITSAALTHCTEGICIRDDGGAKGEGDVRRLVSGGAGLVFKGEGFYLTDYARKKEGSGQKGDTEKGGAAASNNQKGSSGEAPTAAGNSTAD